MLTVRQMDPADAIALLHKTLSPCKVRGLLGLAAEGDCGPAGVALAGSHPDVLHVFHLEGNPDTRRLLLTQLVKLAGGRVVLATSGDGR